MSISTVMDTTSPCERVATSNQVWSRARSHDSNFSRSPHQRTWPRTVQLDGAFFSNSPAMLTRAAERGLGIAVVPNLAVRSQLARGELVVVMPGCFERRDASRSFIRSGSLYRAGPRVRRLVGRARAGGPHPVRFIKGRAPVAASQLMFESSRNRAAETS
jgi:DNA-binding transcriptional LysR family regulator